MTKIFCDIADIKLIRKFEKKSLVKGFTTNPSLIKKTGNKNYKDYCKKILKVTKKPISFEVFADKEKDMINQGMIINGWGNNIYVKVPYCNSKGNFMGKVINSLNKSKIKINVTAVFNHRQTAQILKKINKKTKVIISIFAGRMADKGKDPIPEFKKSISLANKYKNVEILWASTREPYNYLQAKKLKCHIITVPPSIIEKIENFGSSTSALSIDTVKKFLKDSRLLKFKI